MFKSMFLDLTWHDFATTNQSANLNTLILTTMTIAFCCKILSKSVHT